MVIKVTQEDINKGERCSTMSCPLANALLRASGEDVTAVVDTQALVVYTRSTIFYYGHTPETRQFMDRYDNNHECYPVTLDIGEPKCFNR